MFKVGLEDFQERANQRHRQSWTSSVGRKTGLLFCFLVIFCVPLFFTRSSAHQQIQDDTDGLPGSAFGWRSGNRSGEQSPSNSSCSDKLRIVACARVTSETPYLFEWIEFHRLQGVDKFVFYNDAIPSDSGTVASTLELDWLAAFYRDAERRKRQAGTTSGSRNNRDFIPCTGVEDVVEVQSASLLFYDAWDQMKGLDHHNDVTHTVLQQEVYTDCVGRFMDRAEFILAIDVDEYLYSPEYETVWDFLVTARNRGSNSSGVFEKAIGFYLPSINFGSSGVLWDFHNFLAPDYTSGSIPAYYDPRDSSLYQFLRQLNGSSALSPSELANQLDAFRISRLRDQSHIPTGNVNEFSEHLHQRLLRDFPSSVSDKPFLDVLSIPTAHAGEAEDSPLKGLGEHIGVVLSQLQRSRNESLQWQHHLPSNSHSSVASSDLEERVKLYGYYVRNSALFYPLIIEEQIRRGGSSYSWLDPFGTDEKIAKKLFPVCDISDDQGRQQYLIDREGYQNGSYQLATTLDTLSFICRGDIPGVLTQNGKIIYETASMHRNQSTRSSGLLTGCNRPSIHSCNHKIYDGYIDRADVHTELRLDHHQFRSYERRSFNLPAWRGGPMGYAKMNYTILQQFLTSIVDTGKLRFVPKLRERLAQLHVLPKMPDYLWNTKMENDKVTEISIDYLNVTRKCSAIELLGRHQTMCPSDYPHVGYLYTHQLTPNSYLPYSWCSDVPMYGTGKPEDASYGLFDLVKFYPAETNSTDAQLFEKHTVLCPSFGDVRCCDYDSMLQEYQ